MHLYYALACAVMAVHALFIVWVIFGAALTRRRSLLRWVHIGSLVWGVWIEVDHSSSQGLALLAHTLDG